MKYSAPKGTKDILPGEITAWQWLEQRFVNLCGRFAFKEIRLPTFEQTSLYQRGVGDTTDIVQKEMYTFIDKGDRSITLRPEGTAGVVRSYVENGMASLPSPVKLFYMITAFRYEKMQKGRYREFHQFGCELFGAAGPQADVELIALLALFFQEIGLKETSLQINSIGCPTCRPLFHQALQDYFRDDLKDMCDSCQERFHKNPLRILDCKEKQCQPFIIGAPSQLDYLCEECQTHFDELCRELKVLDLDFTINKRIVRGLDYYTKTVFEFVSKHVGTQGTICGGGRYDGLIAEIGGQSTPAVGFALGVERLLLELESQGADIPELPSSDLYIVSRQETKDEAAKLAKQLRGEGIRVEVDLLERSFKAQLKYADKTKASFLLVLGEEEIKSQMVKLKNMTERQEDVIQIRELSTFIKSKLHNS